MSNYREARSRRSLKPVGYRIVTTVLALLACMQLVAISTFTGPVSLTANWGIAVPGTGNPTAEPNVATLAPYMSAATFTNAEVRNFITPTNPDCGSTQDGPSATCRQVAVDYPASFFPVILFGLKQLVSPTWDVSVGTGVNNLRAALQTAFSQDPTGHFYLTGYSQGGTVVSDFKATYPNLPLLQDLPPKDQVTFVMAANPNRPNGGLITRAGILPFPFTIPILNLTVGTPAPTDTGIKTTDIVVQYDGVSDFPEYPINVLADLNALAGVLFIHPTYVYPNGVNVPAVGTTPASTVGHPEPAHPYGWPGPSAPNGTETFTEAVANAQQLADSGHCADPGSNCQVHGDTTYITLPTTNLPLLAPLFFLGKKNNIPALSALADLLNPAMKVLVETGYNRTDYSQNTPFALFPIINPVTLGFNLVAATFEGINNAIGDLNGTRALPDEQDPFVSAADLLNPGDPPPPPPSTSTTLPPQTANTVTTNALKAKALSTSAPLTSSAPSGLSATNSGTTGSTTPTTTAATTTKGGTAGSTTPTTTSGTTASAAPATPATTGPGTPNAGSGSSPSGTSTTGLGSSPSGTSTTSNTGSSTSSGTGAGTQSSSNSGTAGTKSTSGTK